MFLITTERSGQVQTTAVHLLPTLHCVHYQLLRNTCQGHCTMLHVNTTNTFQFGVKGDSLQFSGKSMTVEKAQNCD